MGPSGLPRRGPSQSSTPRCGTSSTSSTRAPPPGRGFRPLPRPQSSPSLRQVVAPIRRHRVWPPKPLRHRLRKGRPGPRGELGGRGGEGLDDRRRGVRTPVTGPVLGPQLHPRRPQPLIVASRRPRPHGTRVIAMRRLVRGRTTQEVMCGGEELRRLQSHLEDVGVAVPTGCLGGIKIQGEDVRPGVTRSRGPTAC